MDQETELKLEGIREELASSKLALGTAGMAAMSIDPSEAKKQRKTYDEADLAVRTASFKRELLLDKIAKQRAREELEQETGTIA
jgi:hypothetical protein